MWTRGKLINEGACERRQLYNDYPIRRGVQQINKDNTSSPWIWKGVSATLQSGRYALSYPATWKVSASMISWHTNESTTAGKKADIMKLRRCHLKLEAEDLRRVIGRDQYIDQSHDWYRIKKT